MYTGIRLLLFIHFFILHFSFQLSNFKIFLTLLSGTVRPTNLKLGTDMESGCMYSVLSIPELGCYFLFVPLFLHFSFSPLFKH